MTVTDAVPVTVDETEADRLAVTEGVTDAESVDELESVDETVALAEKEGVGDCVTVLVLVPDCVSDGLDVKVTVKVTEGD